MCLSIDLTLETPVFTPIFHFQAHSLSVKCLDVSKRYLVSGSNDEHIRIYDLQKRKELGTLLAHQGSITNLQFSKATAEVTDNKGSGKWLLSASDDNKIIVWRVKDWENFGTLKGHTARINDMDIHPSNRVVASVSDDHSIRLWNLMTVKKAAVLKLKKYNQNGQFVRWLKPDGKYFAVALMTKVIIYDTATAKVFKEVDTGKKTIMHMEIVTLDDNEYIVVGLGDGNVNFYKLNEILESNDVEFNEKPEFSLLGHTNRVKDLKFYKNEFGTYMVTVGSDGKVIVWDMEKKDQIAVYDCGERLNCLTLCDESIEKADTMRKRTLDQTELGEQSEVESDTEELKKVMFGNKKKSKKSKKNKKAKKVEVQLE